MRESKHKASGGTQTGKLASFTSFRLNRFGHVDWVCFCGELAGLNRSCLFRFKRLWYVALAGLSGVGSALQGATG